MSGHLCLICLGAGLFLLSLIRLLEDIFHLKRILRRQQDTYARREQALQSQQHAYRAFRERLRERLVRLGDTFP